MLIKAIFLMVALNLYMLRIGENMKKLTIKDLEDAFGYSNWALPRIAGKQLAAQIISELSEYKKAEEDLGVNLIEFAKKNIKK